MLDGRSESPRIQVLLASYNGNKFLRAQIESILAQVGEEISLLIRDDGSTDGSIELILEFEKAYPGKVAVLRDLQGNLGAAGNFLALIQASDAEYVLLADQDDVWLPDKVTRTLEEMRRAETRHGKAMPILVHTDLMVVNRDLSLIAKSFWAYQKLDPRRDGLNRLLVQNVVTGCTIMINRSMRKLVRPVAVGMVEHDWWLALIAATFGRICYVPRATVFYRQHDDNAVGAKKWNVYASLKKTLNREGGRVFSANLAKTRRQAALLKQEYGNELPMEIRQLVDAYSSLGKLNYLARLTRVLRYRFFKIGLIRNLGMLLRL